MRKPNWWKVLCGLTFLVVAIYGFRTMTMNWQTVSTTFMKADKPYGGGAFRIDGTGFMSLKIADPEIKFKPVQERADPEKAEPAEGWMNDPTELLNRTTVNFLRGTIDGAPTRLFQQRGQFAAWWYSRDWSTIYVSTEWTDYKAAQSGKGEALRETQLWKSIDGGKTWAHMEWPQKQHIARLLFIDRQKGYAIGDGPRVWRTADGGDSWREIDMPRHVNNGERPQNLDGIDLSADGVLRLALYVDGVEGIYASTLVLRLDWGVDQFRRETTLKQQAIVSLRSAPGDLGNERIYALSALGALRDLVNNPRDKTRRTGAISTWTAGRPDDIQQLHTFDARFTLDGMSVGKHGVLLVYATDASRDGAPHDVTFDSSDGGTSWEEQDDGISQGGYFDPDTNTLYRLYGYTLKKRTF